MKKSYFAFGVVLTGLAVWGVFNPLSYINAFEVLAVGGTMEGVDGLVGFFLVWLGLSCHLGFVIKFIGDVVRRIKEVM